MSKVLVDRELLERCVDRWVKEAQPAEAEGVDLQRLAAEFDAAPDDAEWEPPHPIFQMARDLDRVTAALSAVTAERDAVAARLAEWERSTLVRENVELTAERDRLRDAAGKAIAWLDAEQNESGVGINRRLKLCRDAENSLRAAMAAKEA